MRSTGNTIVQCLKEPGALSPRSPGTRIGNVAAAVLIFLLGVKTVFSLVLGISVGLSETLIYLVEHAPAPFWATDDGTGPDRDVVEGGGVVIWDECIRKLTPIDQLARNCMADGGMEVPLLRLQQGTGCFEVEGMVVHSVVGEPAIPGPGISQQ